MIRLALLLVLFLTSPAWSQTVLFLDEEDGDLSGCPGVDDELRTTFGDDGVAKEQLHDSEGEVDLTWNQSSSDIEGKTFSGLWDCNLFFEVGSGGGPPNRATIKLVHVNVACVEQEVIFEETTGALPADTVTEYNCTGATKAITFGSTDGILLIAWRDNGSIPILLNYNLAARDSNITIPPETGRSRLMIIGKN